MSAYKKLYITMRKQNTKRITFYRALATEHVELSYIPLLFDIVETHENK